MRHNEVLLCGWVDIEPKVVKDEKTGEFLYAMGRIFTIRGVRRFGTKADNIKYDEPMIYTHNKQICGEMAQWKHGDIVEVKGSLVTKDVTKSTICKHCGAKNSNLGTITYVSPIYTGIRESCKDSKKDALAKLKKICEISNYATVIGLVCREPSLYKKGKTFITSYQLAVRRKFRIKEDAEDARTDFPWVKSYGAIGENDALALKKGSYVFIDGWVQARSFQRTQICAHCGEAYEWNDTSQELVPFATEYMKDCNSLEEIEEAKKLRVKLAEVKVLGKKDNEEEMIPQNSKPDDLAGIMETLDKLEGYIKNKEEAPPDGDPDDTPKSVRLEDLI